MPARPSEMLSEVTERLGPVLVLVNNAGITADNLSMRLSDEDWSRVLDVNLTARIPAHSGCDRIR